MIHCMVLLASFRLNACYSKDVEFSYNPQSGMHLEFYHNIHAQTFDINLITQILDLKIGITLK